MEFNSLSDNELMDKIEEACLEDNKKLKEEIARHSSNDPRVPALVFEMLYEIIDFDLNFIIEILKNAAVREKKSILEDAMDAEGLEELFGEYNDVKNLTVEYIVQGRGEDALWMIHKGAPQEDLSRSYLERCLLAIAYYLGFEEEISNFFETEKRKYLASH